MLRSPTGQGPRGRVLALVRYRANVTRSAEKEDVGAGAFSSLMRVQMFKILTGKLNAAE